MQVFFVEVLYVMKTELYGYANSALLLCKPERYELKLVFLLEAIVISDKMDYCMLMKPQEQLVLDSIRGKPNAENLITVFFLPPDCGSGANRISAANQNQDPVF
jgi:hypothetical protein